MSVLSVSRGLASQPAAANQASVFGRHPVTPRPAQAFAPHSHGISHGLSASQNEIEPLCGCIHDYGAGRLGPRVVYNPLRYGLPVTVSRPGIVRRHSVTRCQQYIGFFFKYPGSWVISPVCARSGVTAIIVRMIAETITASHLRASRWKTPLSLLATPFSRSRLRTTFRSIIQFSRIPVPFGFSVARLSRYPPSMNNPSSIWCV